MLARFLFLFGLERGGGGGGKKKKGVDQEYGCLMIWNRVWIWQRVSPV